MLMKFKVKVDVACASLDGDPRRIAKLIEGAIWRQCANESRQDFGILSVEEVKPSSGEKARIIHELQAKIDRLEPLAKPSEDPGKKVIDEAWEKICRIFSEEIHKQKTNDGAELLGAVFDRIGHAIR